MLSNLKKSGNAQILEKTEQRRLSGGLSPLQCFVFDPGEEDCPTGFRPDGTRCSRMDLPYIPLNP